MENAWAYKGSDTPEMCAATSSPAAQAAMIP